MDAALEEFSEVGAAIAGVTKRVAERIKVVAKVSARVQSPAKRA